VNRVEELLLKWRGAGLSDAERVELNALLATPDNRALLVREFQFDTLARETLREMKAEVGVGAAAQAFPLHELRQPRAEAFGFDWSEAVHRFFRSFAVRVALSAAALALVAWIFLRPDPSSTVLAAGGTGVTIGRASKTFAASARELPLRAGDRLMIADDGRGELANRAQTVSAVFAGPAELRLNAPAEFEVRRGEFLFTASGQTPLRVHAGATLADAADGSFRITVGTNLVRLEVESGNVTWRRLDDGRELTVTAGYFAVAGAEQPFTAEPLVPQPWLVQDIGSVAAPAVARFDGDVVRVSSGSRGPPGPPGGWNRPAGSGKGKWKGKHRGGGAEEGFHFVYRELRGDGEIRARVIPEAGVPGVEAGLAIRRDLTDGAPMAFVGGEQGQPPEFRRGYRGGRWRANNPPADDGRRGPPYWVRLVRQGGKVIAYKSDDGQQWAETGSETLDLGETAFVGLVATSRSGASGAATVFDSVTVIRLP
jgi:hypothetical protein